MMVLLSGALRNSPTGGKLQALEGWQLLLKALAQHAGNHLGGMANQVRTRQKLSYRCAAGTA